MPTQYFEHALVGCWPWRRSTASARPRPKADLVSTMKTLSSVLRCRSLPSGCNPLKRMPLSMVMRSPPSRATSVMRRYCIVSTGSSGRWNGRPYSVWCACSMWCSASSFSVPYSAGS